MLEHRMVGEADLADDARALGAGLQALERDALLHDVALDAVETPEEIEVPPGAAELAVGDRLEPDLLLLLDDALDLAVLDRLELGGVISPLARCSRASFSAGRTQQAADVIGAERRLGSLHVVTLRYCAWRRSGSSSSRDPNDRRHCSTGVRVSQALDRGRYGESL